MTKTNDRYKVISLEIDVHGRREPIFDLIAQTAEEWKVSRVEAVFSLLEELVARREAKP